MEHFALRQLVGGVATESILPAHYQHATAVAPPSAPPATTAPPPARKPATQRAKCSGCDKNLKIKCDFLLCKTCCNNASNECRIHDRNNPGYTGGKSVEAYERHLKKAAAEQQKQQAMIAQNKTNPSQGITQMDVTTTHSPAVSAQMQALQQQIQRAAQPHLQISNRHTPQGRPPPSLAAAAAAAAAALAAAAAAAPSAGATQAAAQKAAPPAAVENVDLREVLSAHQREAEEVRLWRQALYSRERQRRQEVAREAMERYRRNCSMLQELFTPHPGGPAGLFQDQRDAIQRLHGALLQFSSSRGLEGADEGGVSEQLGSSGQLPAAAQAERAAGAWDRREGVVAAPGTGPSGDSRAAGVDSNGRGGTGGAQEPEGDEALSARDGAGGQQIREVGGLEGAGGQHRDSPGEWVGPGAGPPGAAAPGSWAGGGEARRDPRDPRGRGGENGPSPPPFLPTAPPHMLPPLHISPDPSIFPPSDTPPAVVPVLQRRDPRAALRLPSPLGVSPIHSPTSMPTPSPEPPMATPSPHYYMAVLQVPAASLPPAPGAAAPGEIAWSTRRLPDPEEEEDEEGEGEGEAEGSWQGGVRAPAAKRACHRVELRRDDPEVLGLLFSRSVGDAVAL